MTRIVFVGNCQAETLSLVYKRCIAPVTGAVASHVLTYTDPSDADRAALSQADIIVEQVFDFEQRFTLAVPGRSVRMVRFPWVAAHFLWPHFNEAHPRNTPTWFLPSGPWPAQLGDSVLNRMISQGVGAAEAAARYLDLDLATTARLDRRYEMIIDRQRDRDAQAEMETANYIETRFRDERLFVSPDHPDLGLFLHLACQVYERLGASSADMARVRSMLSRTPFPLEESPIHPAVARHFGLRFWRETDRYRHLRSGWFSAAEYYRRYMDYQWDEIAHEGIALAETGRDEDALARLGEGVQRSPRCGAAFASLAHVLARLGRSGEAEAAARQAVALAPDDPAIRSSLGHVMARLGRRNEAAAAFAESLALDPDAPHTQMSLSHALVLLGRHDEAIAPARAGIAAEPFRPEWQAHLDALLDHVGRAANPR